MDYSYDLATSRNLGWVTQLEQSRLRLSRVAIAGLGGVGGSHLLTLARLGVGSFSIADPDVFGAENLNRQVGATMATVGKPKVRVLADMAFDVNPELQVRAFDSVDRSNVRDFLYGADAYVDGLDFFAFAARRLVFAECRRLGIPAVTAAPIGMGAALLNFMPYGMSFDDYFGWETGMDEAEMALRFLVGLAPSGLHRSYLVDRSRVSLAERRGPSTAMACQLCAGVVGTEVLKVLLGRGRARAAPHGAHFDAYRSRLVRTWRPGGHRHPLQRLILAVARRQLGHLDRETA